MNPKCSNCPNTTTEEKILVFVQDYRENEFPVSYLVNRKQLKLLEDLAANDFICLITSSNGNATDMT